MGNLKIKNLLAYARAAFDQMQPGAEARQEQINSFIQQSRINELMKDEKYAFGDIFMALSHAYNVVLNALDVNAGFAAGSESGIPLIDEIPAYGTAGSLINAILINSTPESLASLCSIIDESDVEGRVRKALRGVERSSKTHKLALLIAAVRIVEELAEEVRAEATTGKPFGTPTGVVQ